MNLRNFKDQTKSKITEKHRVNDSNLKQKLNNLKTGKAANPTLFFQRYQLTEKQWMILLNSDQLKKFFSIRYLDHIEASYNYSYSRAKKYQKQILTGRVIKKMIEVWSQISSRSENAISFIYSELEKDPDREAIQFFKEKAFANIDDYCLGAFCQKFGNYLTDEEYEYCLKKGCLAKSLDSLTVEEAQKYLAYVGSQPYYRQRYCTQSIIEDLQKTANDAVINYFIEQDFKLETILRREYLTEQQIDLLLDSEIFGENFYNYNWDATIGKLIKFPMKQHQFIKLLQKCLERDEKTSWNSSFQISFDEKSIIQLFYHLSPALGLKFLTHKDADKRIFAKELQEFCKEEELNEIS